MIYNHRLGTDVGLWRFSFYYNNGPSFLCKISFEISKHMNEMSALPLQKSMLRVLIRTCVHLLDIGLFLKV